MIFQGNVIYYKLQNSLLFRKVLEFGMVGWFSVVLLLVGGSEKLLRVCLNLPYFLRYINRFQDAVSANSFFIMPATVADATAVRNG
jgi:hypothetical protein